MPSKTTLVEEVLDPPEGRIHAPRIVTPRVKQAKEKEVVSYEHWLENEEDYLLDIYQHIQETNLRGGRRVFDKDTCDFPQFCRLAYMNSFKYKKKEAYIYDENDLEYENADTYVFE
jgi:hypothetical protein